MAQKGGDTPSKGGGAVNFMTALKWIVALVGAYVLVGPATISHLLSGAATPSDLAAAVAKLSGAGAVIGAFHLPFPQHHGRGWHIFGWSIGSGILVLTAGIWFPAVLHLGEALIVQGSRFLPPAPALPPAGPPAGP